METSLRDFLCLEDLVVSDCELLFRRITEDGIQNMFWPYLTWCHEDYVNKSRVRQLRMAILFTNIFTKHLELKTGKPVDIPLFESRINELLECSAVDELR